MAVDRTFSLSGIEPRTLFSDSLKRKWKHAETLAGMLDGEEVVVLACGPSLPKQPVWRERAPHMKVFGVNRAFFTHRLDWWTITSDMLVLEPQDMLMIENTLPREPKILAANYAVEVRQSGAPRALRVINNAVIFDRIPNDLYLYDPIGNKCIRSIFSEYDKYFRQACVYGHRSVLTSLIELLRLFGAKKVHLFGHDGQMHAGRYYFNEKLKPDEWMRTQTDLVFRRMLASLAWAQEHLWEGKIEVVNYCKDSANKIWPRRDPEVFPS